MSLNIWSKGSRVNIVDICGSTACSLAFENGHFDVTKFLVENGADLHVKYGNTDFLMIDLVTNPSKYSSLLRLSDEENLHFAKLLVEHKSPEPRSDLHGIGKRARLLPWSWKIHHLYPRFIRRQIRELAMLNKKEKCQVKRIPKDVLFIICVYLVQ
jgi:ankyrin repeat protein